MRLCVTICFSKLLWLVIPRACGSLHNVHQHYIHNSGWLQWIDIPEKHYLQRQRFEFWTHHSLLLEEFNLTTALGLRITHRYACNVKG